MANVINEIKNWHQFTEKFGKEYQMHDAVIKRFDWNGDELIVVVKIISQRLVMTISMASRLRRMTTTRIFMNLSLIVSFLLLNALTLNFCLLQKVSLFKGG